MTTESRIDWPYPVWDGLKTPPAEDEPPLQPKTAGERQPRPVSQYEQATPEKRAFGARMRKAREVADLQLSEVAKALGYSQPVQLSLMETGHRMPTLAVIIAFARLTGTTTDYLCGLSTNLERDPLVEVHHAVAARVTADMRRLICALTEANATTVREFRPDSGRMARLAGVALEAVAAMERVRLYSPQFEDMRGGATLLSKIETAGRLAQEHMEAVKRARRALDAQVPGITFEGLDADELPPDGYSLSTVIPLPADTLAEEK